MMTLSEFDITTDRFVKVCFPVPTYPWQIC
jgi:hypothetical protein